MNNDIDLVINGPVAILAWFALVVIIAMAAAIGILCGHGPTATAVLAAIAICIGFFAALATLTSKKKTSNVLAITAALSAVAGLLVSEADTIQQIATKPDTKTAIAIGVLTVTILLTNVIFQHNRENDDPGNRRDQTPLLTATGEDEPDEQGNMPT